MVFFVMERKKTDVLLQPWASSRPRFAGASQVVFIMRQTRIQILGCGCSPHLADWMLRRATSRRWEVNVQMIHCKRVFLKQYLFPVSTPAKSLTCLCFGGRVWTWCAVERHEPRVWLQHLQRHDDAAQHQSAYIDETHTRPAHFTMSVQMSVGFIHWHFTNVYCTACTSVCEWHFYCTAMLRGSVAHTIGYFLGPQISVVVTRVYLFLITDFGNVFSKLRMCFALISSRVRVLWSKSAA